MREGGAREGRTPSSQPSIEQNRTECLHLSHLITASSINGAEKEGIMKMKLKEMNTKRYTSIRAVELFIHQYE